MERQSNSRSFGGLVRKVVAPLVVGAAALMPVGNADGGFIYLYNDFGNTVNAPGVQLGHQSGATDGYDSTKDFIYQFPTTNGSIVDFYSVITGNNLSDDERDILSTTPYHAQMQGRNLTELTQGNLQFFIDTPSDFGTLPIWADVYKSIDGGLTNSAVFQNIDVRDYAANNTTIPLSLGSNSDVYNIDIRLNSVPEPSTGAAFLSLATMAGLGFGAKRYFSGRRKEE